MSLFRFMLTITAVVLLASPAHSQDPETKAEGKVQKVEQGKDALQKVIQKAQEDYRTFFREPKTALEFWAAAEFEIQVGKFDVAAYLLDQILKLPEKEADEDLLKIEQAEGLRSFLRLKLVKEWSKEPEMEAQARKAVDVLIDRVQVALDKSLGNRERITELMQGLFDKTPEVRGFALVQLMRTKHRAAPIMAEALRTVKPEQQRVLLRAMAALDPEFMPPLLELYRARDAKDAADVEFLANLLWLAKARADKRVVPYLWHMSEAPIYPKVIQNEARDTLALLLETRPEQLPLAKIALTQLAERYLQYRVRYPDSTAVADRDDPTKQLVMPAYKKWYVGEDGRIKDTPDVLTPDDARLEFGLLFARQALDLDKSYLPAQSVYLALLLEAEFTRKPYEGRLDKLLTEPPTPALRQLLAKIDADLLAATLERAIVDQDYAVALPLIDAAGDRGEVRLAQASSGSSQGLLVRLLYDPDRRLQFAAARALLKLPTSLSPVASTRVVEVLQRFLASGRTPRVLIVQAKNERAAQLRNAVKEAGYESDVVGTAKEALELLHKSAGYDAILLNYEMPHGELPFALTQLRADQDAGLLPLVLIAAAGREDQMAAGAQRMRNVFIVPDVYAINGQELKKQLDDAIRFSVAPVTLRTAPYEQQNWLRYEVRRAKGQAVSEQEKKQFARDSLDWFAQMARGELPGYDLLPAKNALLQSLNNDEMAVQALRIIARYNNVETQQRLAGILFDSSRANLHITAAKELTKHIQRNGLVLTADQIGHLRNLEQKLDQPAALRTELAAVVGSMRTSPQMTGSRLLNYRPEPQAAPGKKDEK